MKQGVCIFGSSGATRYRDNRGAEGWSCVPRVPLLAPAQRALPAQGCRGSVPARPVPPPPGFVFPRRGLPLFPNAHHSQVAKLCPKCCECTLTTFVGGCTGVTNAWDFRARGALGVGGDLLMEVGQGAGTEERRRQRPGHSSMLNRMLHWGQTRHQSQEGADRKLLYL